MKYKWGWKDWVSIGFVLIGLAYYPIAAVFTSSQFVNTFFADIHIEFIAMGVAYLIFENHKEAKQEVIEKQSNQLFENQTHYSRKMVRTLKNVTIFIFILLVILTLSPLLTDLMNEVIKGTDTEIAETSIENLSPTLTSIPNPSGLALKSFFDNIVVGYDLDELYGFQEKCSSNDVSKFINFWTEFIPKYTIYKCSDQNTYEVNIKYFYREYINFTKQTSDKDGVWVRYILAESQKGWEIIDCELLNIYTTHCDFFTSNE